MFQCHLATLASLYLALTWKATLSQAYSEKASLNLIVQHGGACKRQLQCQWDSFQAQQHSVKLSIYTAKAGLDKEQGRCFFSVSSTPSQSIMGTAQVHTVAIWTFTFHEKSGSVQLIWEANFKSTYRQKIQLFGLEIQIYYSHFSSIFAEFVKSSAFYTLLLLFQTVDMFEL